MARKMCGLQEICRALSLDQDNAILLSPDALHTLGGQVEFILMGGTFMSLPLDYRDYFIRGLHDALSGHTSSNVDEAVRFSEQSHTRCIGLTIETRPDYCLHPHLQQVPAPSQILQLFSSNFWVIDCLRTINFACQ